jgi:pimeloyl-ACP methyl ester carboxylesterase
VQQLSCAGPALGEQGDAITVKSGMALVAEPALYYETAGQGPALVLIHGGNLDHRMWEWQLQPFAKSFQVICYDVRTYGRSDFPTRPYSDTNDLKSLLEFLGVKKAHLVGLSLGGRIAIDFAIEHPEMVSSIVAVGPGLGGFQWDRQGEKEFAAALRAAQDGNDERVAELWLQSGYMKPAMEHPELVARLRQWSKENYRNWLGNPLLAKTLDPPAIKRLGEIKAPTLVIVGSRDVPDIQKIVKTVTASVPNAKKVVIEGAGHMVNMEKPEEFNRIVLDFLRSQK